MKNKAKTLIIVESPAKAKSISKFLGRNYTVKASMGHVRDLPKSQFGVDIENNFQPKYITIRGKGKIVKELKSSLKNTDSVFLAADPDREGEAITWHLRHILGIDESKPCRIEFNEITKEAIQQAVKKPRPINLNLVNAQQARRILDRIVGYMLSPLLWRKVKKGLSAGRVQSVAVRIIVDREEEIKNFVPEEYWSLTAVLSAKESDAFEAKLIRYSDKKVNIKNKDEMDEILNELKKSDFLVDNISYKEKLKYPAEPFITSTLQQEAYRKLGFTSHKTMMIAQQLYEGLDIGKRGTTGLITYIRTDSKRVSETTKKEALEFIRERFGEDYLPNISKKVNKKKTLKIQDAHEAIRPTDVHLEPDELKQHLTGEQYKLYKLIWSRFIASQMAPAVIGTNSLDIVAGKCIFRASVSSVKFSGFMKVYIEGNDNKSSEDALDSQKELPKLNKGDKLNLKELIPKQHFTQPPPRYTEATLVKALEENGIGRPSTYAPIIDTIQKRGYVVRENKQFYPTELGEVIVELLKKHFPEIVSIKFTAEMEEKLDKIEEGEVDWITVLKDFYISFSSILKTAENKISNVEIEDEVTDEVCSECGRNLVIKFGRYGKFLACPGFPDCKFTKPLLEQTGVLCPECGGDIVIRRSKKGRVLYGCSNYPNCGFVIWNKPSKQKCPKCGSIMIYKNSRSKDKKIQCINGDCKYQTIEDKSNVESL
ncbi:type I DNA topoisomerase [Peptococcaceae bacterium]|nr:type I DNA topoisomerase [Peptococcaceae bacterium]